MRRTRRGRGRGRLGRSVEERNWGGLEHEEEGREEEEGRDKDEEGWLKDRAAGVAYEVVAGHATWLVERLEQRSCFLFYRAVYRL